MNQCPPGPQVFHCSLFEFFVKIRTDNLINIHLRISPRIFENIWNGPTGILRDPRDTDLEKNLKAKISCQTPFKFNKLILSMRLKSLRPCWSCAWNIAKKCEKNYKNIYFLQVPKMLIEIGCDSVRKLEPKFSWLGPFSNSCCFQTYAEISIKIKRCIFFS
jgi:hypothetical protein